MKKLLIVAASCVAVCAIGAAAYYAYKVFEEESFSDDFEDFGGFAYEHSCCSDE